MYVRSFWLLRYYLKVFLLFFKIILNQQYLYMLIFGMTFYLCNCMCMVDLKKPTNIYIFVFILLLDSV